MIIPERRRKQFPAGENGGFKLSKLVFSIVVLGVVLALVLATFLSNRRHASGDACNAVLDSIYSAKEQVAYSAKIGAGSATIPLDLAELNTILRGIDVRDPCPVCGAKYIIGDINASDGTIIVPVCPCEQNDAGDGKTDGQQGHHIYRRAYVQGAEGDYRRKAGLTFASTDMTR